MNEQTTKVYTRENWAEMITARDRGERLEIDEEIFDYFLEVLPPVYMGRKVTLPGGEVVRAAFGFAEGWETVTAFWMEGGAFQDSRRFFCQRTKEMNPNA